MKKKLKIFLTFCLIFILSLSFCITAYATEAEPVQEIWLDVPIINNEDSISAYSDQYPPVTVCEVVDGEIIDTYDLDIGHVSLALSRSGNTTKTELLFNWEGTSMINRFRCTKIVIDKQLLWGNLSNVFSFARTNLCSMGICRFLYWNYYINRRYPNSC